MGGSHKFIIGPEQFCKATYEEAIFFKTGTSRGCADTHQAKSLHKLEMLNERFGFPPRTMINAIMFVGANTCMIKFLCHVLCIEFHCIAFYYLDTSFFTVHCL